MDYSKEEKQYQQRQLPQYLNVEAYDASKADGESSFDDRASYDTSDSIPQTKNNTSNTSTNSTVSTNSNNSRKGRRSSKKSKRKSKSKKHRKSSKVRNKKSKNSNELKQRKYIKAQNRATPESHGKGTQEAHGNTRGTQESHGNTRGTQESHGSNRGTQEVPGNRPQQSYVDARARESQGNNRRTANGNDSHEGQSAAPNRHKSKRKKRAMTTASLKPRKKASSKRAKDAYAALTKQERREFRNAFRLFDKDDDGQITIDELREVFEGLNYHFTHEQLSHMIECIDDNSDGVIDIHDFVLVMNNDTLYSDKNNIRSYLEEIKEAFEVFDKDGDGSISIDELAHIMEALGEKLQIKDIVDMMFEADEDGNGNIDFDEFLNLMEEDHILYRYNQGTAIGNNIMM